MRETLVTLLTVCAAGACADNVMAAAEDGGRNIGRYVRLVFALVVISAVLLPTVSRGKSMADSIYDAFLPTAASENFDISSQDLVKDECRRELEGKISALLCEKFGFGINAPTVCIELTEEKSEDTITLSISSVSVELDGENTSDAETETEEVTAYVRELTGCDNVCVSKKIGREGESH